MKKTPLLSVMACALVATASATSTLSVPLFDRMAEFDLGVAAVGVRLEIIDTVDAAMGKAFVPVGHIRVEEVFRGAGVKVGGEIEVAMCGPMPTEAMAEGMGEGMKGRRVVWFCQRCPTGSPVRFTVVAGTSPSDPKLWEPQLKAYRERASELARLGPLELSLTLEPGTIVQELPTQATVSLRVAGREPGRLPGALTWRGALAVEIDRSVPARDPRGAVRHALPFCPGIAVLNVRATPKSDLPARLEPGVTVRARALIRVTGVDASKGPMPAMCFATIWGPKRQKLVCSPRVRFLVVDPPSQDQDRRALHAVAGRNLWHFMGPHDLAPTDIQVEGLKALFAEHRGALIGPAIECGLVFAGDRGFPRDERIERLRELSRIEYLGFAEDCMVRLAAELRDAGRGDEAQAVLDQLAARRPR